MNEHPCWRLSPAENHRSATIIDAEGKSVARVYGGETAANEIIEFRANNQALSKALDNAIEQITAQLVHGDVANEGWQRTLDELVAVQKGSAK